MIAIAWKRHYRMLFIVSTGTRKWGTGNAASTRIRQQLRREFPLMAECVIADDARGLGWTWTPLEQEARCA